MRKFSFFFILAALVFGSHLALASTGETDKPFLRPATSSEIPLPTERRVGSTFFAMDTRAFEGLATWKQFICTIENLEIPGIGTYTARVEQFDVVDASTIGKSPISKHAFFSGSLDGAPGSHLCMTFFYDRAYGYINIGDHSFIMSAAGRSETGDLIVGIIEDTTPASVNCGTKEWNMAQPGSLPGVNELIEQVQQQQADQPLSTTVSQIRVSLALDDTVCKLLGGTDTGSFKYAMSVVAAASDLYKRDANVSLLINEHIEYADTNQGDPFDQYGDHTACELLDYFNNSIFSSVKKPQLYVLMSGRHTDWCGGVAADIAVLNRTPNNKCVLGIKHSVNTYGPGTNMNWYYPYTSWTWDAMVCAHETGHVVACAHTHNCYFYNSFGGDGPIDSCYQAEGSCFTGTKSTRGTIMSYCHLQPAGATLNFHPLCINAIKHYVGLGTSGAISKGNPSIALSPSRAISTCLPRTKITITAGGGMAPYSFEVNSFNKKTDSVFVAGNICTYWLQPTKSNQKYYFRVTTADTVRSYDSVIFSAGSVQATITKNANLSKADSIMLVASIPDTTGGKCTWYAVGAAYRPIPTPNQWQLMVPRPLEGNVDQYFTKVIIGSCTAQDTISVDASIITPPESVAAEVASAPMRLYPNPAHDRISLLLPVKADRVWIADALGREISAPQTHAMMQVGNHEGEQIDFAISQLLPGSYWIVRDVNGTTQTVAFQKQ